MEELVLGLEETRQQDAQLGLGGLLPHGVRQSPHPVHGAPGPPDGDGPTSSPGAIPATRSSWICSTATRRVRAFVDEATALGREIYRRTSNGSAARALRRRKEILATMIDRVSSTTSAAHVLTLGCGHLREAELSSAVNERRVERFVAVDRDPDTLRVVREKFGPLGIETAEGTVNELIENADKLGRFDFVYAAGPYDLLNRLTATRLTEALFRCTRSGRAAARDELRSRREGRGLHGGLHGLEAVLPQRRRDVQPLCRRSPRARWPTGGRSPRRAAGSSSWRSGGGRPAGQTGSPSYTGPRP